MNIYEMNKISDFEFHVTNIEDLVNDGNYLIEIPDFPSNNPDQFYSRRDKSGWWMPIKQIIIRDYIDYYLAIIAKNIPNIRLYFMDLLSSWGMNFITKLGGKDKFIFPGTSLNAALISERSSKRFNKFFINDYDHKKRKILDDRLNALKLSHSPKLAWNIQLDENNIDSNKWILEVMREIKNDYCNYLMIIDNEGMNVELDTIIKIKEMKKFGDIIITFQNNVARTIAQSPERSELFFGREIKQEEIRKDNLLDIYLKQLSDIGFKLETIKIESGMGFFYTLIFCCREDVSGKWFRRYKGYAEKEFKNFTGERVKSFWDRATGKVKGLNSYGL